MRPGGGLCGRVPRRAMRAQIFLIETPLGMLGIVFAAHRNRRCHCEPARTLVWQSPGTSENGWRSAKAPLADQGELARASHASARLRGSEFLYFDNPSVKNQRFLPAVHCGMTATGSHGNFDSLRGAPPFAQGSRRCSRTSNHTGVAPSGDSLRSQSVPLVSPLAPTLGELSRSD